MKNTKKLLKNIVGLLICLLLVNGCSKKESNSELQQTKPTIDLPKIKEVPSFSGTNFDGSKFSSQSLKGKVWLASFMFTSCGDICPKLNSQLSALYGEFKDNANLNFVSISVDPDNDTQEVLKKYAERYGAKPNKWAFLRMSIDTVKSLSLEGFRIASLDAPLDHSKRIVLVDSEGQIRGYYDGLDSQDVDKLREVLKKMLISIH
ncbi:MAG: SCO family protein [Ignavibacteriae bacterium]|nr:SCO family protein [Ignavibacteriota bacterium]